MLLKVPVAVNCWFVPFAMLGEVGDTLMDTSVAAVTATVVLPDTFPDIAVMVAEPSATHATSPLEPTSSLTVAAVPFEDRQVTEAVRSFLVASE